MNDFDNGGPAFPVSTRPCEEDHGFGHQDSHSTWQFGGLTMRDYFAAKAMQVELAQIKEFPDENWRHGLALDAYAMADAMLNVRGKK